MCRGRGLGKERSKQRWMDSIDHNLTEKGLLGEDAQDRAAWRRIV